MNQSAKPTDQRSPGEQSLELYRTSTPARMEMTPDQVDLIKSTVAKGATDDELKLFLHLAQTYGLDPFAKEIWCIKYGTKAATIFTSRDGYLKIANGHPAFDGIVGDVVHENDHFQVGNASVEHEYKFPRGNIVGAYALVFRKDRSHPSYVFAPFAEYEAANNPTWRNYPSAMILKVAEAMALKRAFSISGLVTREELDASRDDDDVSTATPARLPAPAPTPTPTPRAEPAPAAEEEPNYSNMRSQAMKWLKSRTPEDFEDAVLDLRGRISEWPKEHKRWCEVDIEGAEEWVKAQRAHLERMRLAARKGAGAGNIEEVQATWKSKLADLPSAWQAHADEVWAEAIIEAEAEMASKAEA